MSEMVKALGAEGPGRVLRVAGREWRFASYTYSLMAEYETWLEATLRDGHYRTLAPLGDPALLARVLADFSERCGRGHYRWGAEGWAEEARTLRGLVKLLELSLRPHQPQIASEDVVGLLLADAEESQQLGLQDAEGRPTTRLNGLLKELLEEGKATALSRLASPLKAAPSPLRASR
jgi:hypothetical protein